MLPRFDVEAAAGNSEELTFKAITKKSEALDYFDSTIKELEKAAAASPCRLGVYPVMDPVRYGEEKEELLSAAAFCIGKRAVFLDTSDSDSADALTEEDLLGIFRKLRAKALEACGEIAADDNGPEPVSICVFGLKNQFPVWGIDSSSDFRDGIKLGGFADLLIECYLVNPLQSDYQPEMTASEYLEESYPTWRG